MKVVIIKSSGDSFWYADLIGKEYEVHPKINRHNEYELIKQVGGSSYYIGVDDCEIVKQD